MSSRGHSYKIFLQTFRLTEEVILRNGVSSVFCHLLTVSVSEWQNTGGTSPLDQKLHGWDQNVLRIILQEWASPRRSERIILPNTYDSENWYRNKY